jgi:signal transduction histidine kinase
MVVGDREKILQVVVNLLTNALKFTPKGGDVVLQCELLPESAGACVTVGDTGRGIPDEEHARIFEPFVQIGRPVGGTDSGVGLGLAISRELARGMGGDLTVESTVGVGSNFHFTIPTSRAAAGSPPPGSSVSAAGSGTYP